MMSRKKKRNKKAIGGKKNQQTWKAQPKWQKLSIIVPYREREDQLRQFLPHMEAYFERDKVDKNIPYHIFVIEQSESEAFNRGKLLNVGFQLTKEEADYHAFHDVDYLPVWSDYTYPDQPTQILYYGTMYLEPEDCFGGVTLFRKEHFELVNGFSNEYWGWGKEDDDLRKRCIHNGLNPTRRKGTYTALSHEHQGYYEDGSPKEAAVINDKKYETKMRARDYDLDGLCSLDFKILRRTSLTTHSTLIEVDIGRPRNE